MNTTTIQITTAIENRTVDGVVSHNGRLEMTRRTIEQTVFIACFNTKAGHIVTAKGWSEQSATRNLLRKIGAAESAWTRMIGRNGMTTNTNTGVGNE